MQHQINRKKRFPFSVFLRIEFLSFLATNIGGKTRRDASRRTICREIVTVSATNRRPKPNYHVDVSRSPTFEARLQTMPDPKLSFFPLPSIIFRRHSSKADGCAKRPVSARHSSLFDSTLWRKTVRSSLRIERTERHIHRRSSLVLEFSPSETTNESLNIVHWIVGVK